MENTGCHTSGKEKLIYRIGDVSHGRSVIPVSVRIPRSNDHNHPHFPSVGMLIQRKAIPSILHGNTVSETFSSPNKLIASMRRSATFSTSFYRSREEKNNNGTMLLALKSVQLDYQVSVKIKL